VKRNDPKNTCTNLLKGTVMSFESSELGAEYGHESGEADFEFDLTSEQGEAGEAESEADIQEMEMASSLMEINNEQDFEQFLGDLISKASSTIGDIAHSPVGQALGGILKSAAKQALPIAGQALGTYIGGPAGGQLGSQLATQAGQIFGLEVEGLSHEDRDFEVNRQFVKFGGEAARRAAHEARRHGGAGNVSVPAAQQIAKSAAIEAAKQFAPGLLKPTGSPTSSASAPQIQQRQSFTPTPQQAPFQQSASPRGMPPSQVPPAWASGQGRPQAYAPAQPARYGTPAQHCPGKHHNSGRWIRKGKSIVLLHVG
jgi:hypothetical protein